MSYLNINKIIYTLLGAFIVGALPGCVEASEWACRRSSECPGEQICRVGECVSGDTYVPEATDPATQRAGDLGEGDPAQQLEDTPPEPACPDGRSPARRELVINELLANVPTGDAGDANKDGTRDAYDDEFVEIVNRSDDVLDISGVTLQVGEHPKFSFESLCLKSMEAAVIFGGGHPTERADFLVRVADSRLSLGNSGGSVQLFDAAGTQIDAITYAESSPTSLNLSPELDGSEYVSHQELNPEHLFSPGICASSASFAQGCLPNEGEVEGEIEGE